MFRWGCISAGFSYSQINCLLEGSENKNPIKITTCTVSKLLKEVSNWQNYWNVTVAFKLNKFSIYKRCNTMK